MNERAYFLIVDWLSGEEPDRDWPVEEYEEVVYSRWTFEEILQLILDHPLELASTMALRFCTEMIQCMENASTDEQKRIFRIAAQSAWEALESIEEVEK